MVKRRKLTNSQAQDDVDDMPVLDDLSEDNFSASSGLDKGIPKADGSSRHGVIAPKGKRAHASRLSSGDIYNSDLLQIQVGELLEVVQPNYGNWMARVDEALRKLKRTIEGLPPQQPMQVAMCFARVLI